MDFLRQDMRFKNEELEDIIVYRTFSDLLKQMIRRVETEMEEEGDEASGEQKARKLLEEEVDQQTKDFLTEEAILDMDYKAFESAFFDTIQEIKEEYIDFETTKHFPKNYVALHLKA